MSRDTTAGEASGDGPLEVRRDGSRAIVVLRGRIDSAAAEPLFAAVSAALREGPEEVALELAEVGFVSSAGMRALIGLVRSLKPLGGSIAVCAAVLKILPLPSAVAFC